MFKNLNPYPQYSDGSIPWAGRLPVHWDSARGKALYRRLQRPARPDDGVVTCFRDGMVTLRTNRRVSGFTEALHEIGYQGIRRGDLVIHAMDAFAGAVGVSDSDGKGTPVYSVCVPLGRQLPEYGALLIREMARSGWILALAKGIRERSTDFRFESFAQQELPCPPLEEQAAIVRYLSHANRRIDKAIAAKRKLIRLLEEQKRVITHQAVTCGAVSGKKTRSTGGCWFPSLPDGWTATNLGRVIEFAIDGPHYSPRYLDSGIPFLSARNIKVDEWQLGNVKYISEEDYRLFSRRVRPEVGDVLYTKGGTTGVARAVDLDFPFQVWVHIAVLRCRAELVDPHYLALALNSPLCYEQSQLETRGATNQDLGLNRMKRIEVPLPKAVEEQRAVVDWAATQSAPIRAALSRTLREITLLQEFRTRLMADVATGQVDVREIAASLPEVSPYELADAVEGSMDDELDELAEESAESGALV